MRKQEQATVLCNYVDIVFLTSCELSVSFGSLNKHSTLCKKKIVSEYDQEKIGFLSNSSFQQD